MESREYAVLKTSTIETAAAGEYNLEILCDANDVELLLDRAEQFYPDAIPYIRSALDCVPRSS